MLLFFHEKVAVLAVFRLHEIPMSVNLPFSWGKVVSYVLTKIARFAKNIPNDAAFRLDALLV